MWAAVWLGVIAAGLALAAAVIWGTEFHWIMKIMVSGIGLLITGNGVMALAYALRQETPRRS